MSRRKDADRLRDIALAIDKIRRYVSGITHDQFLEDERTIDAVIRNFSVIGEAASRLSKQFLNSQPHIAWVKLTSMRNFVVHEYFRVSPSILWATAQVELSELSDQITDLTKHSNDSVEFSKIHPWRRCPKGEHWVHRHTRTVASSEEHPAGQTIVSGHCARNPSKKDVLSKAEITDIAQNYFSALADGPCPNQLGYKDGNSYDKFIGGWTKYWNDIFAPKELLTPNLVKALIATESGFRKSIKVKAGKIQGIARGLMQVTDQAQRSLGSVKGELTDHLVEVDQESLLDPNVNIAAGIRWLFRKKQIIESKAKKSLSWVEVIANYKAYPIEHKQIKRLEKIYAILDECATEKRS